jgi:hypothetical protein
MLLWAVFAVKMSIVHRSIWASGAAAHAIFRDQMVVCVARPGDGLKLGRTHWYVTQRWSVGRGHFLDSLKTYLPPQCYQ